MEQYVALELKTGPRALPDFVHISSGNLVITSGYNTEYDVYIYDEREPLRWRFVGTTTYKTLAGFSGGEYITVCPEGEPSYGDCTETYRLIPENNVLSYEIPFSYSGNNIANVLPITFEKVLDPSSNLRKVVEGIGYSVDQLKRDMRSVAGERTGSYISWTEPEHFLQTEYKEVNVMVGHYGFYNIELIECVPSETLYPSRYHYHDSVDSFMEISGTRCGDLWFDENTRLDELKFYIDDGNNQVVGFTPEFGNIVYAANLLKQSGDPITERMIGFDIVGNRLFLMCEGKLYHAEIPGESNTNIYMQDIDIPDNTGCSGLKIIPNGLVTMKGEYMAIFKAIYGYYSQDGDYIYIYDEYDGVTINEEEVDLVYSMLWTSTDDKLQLYGIFRSDHQKLGPFYVYASRFAAANCWHDLESVERFLWAFNITADVENLDEHTAELYDFNLTKDINRDSNIYESEIGVTESGADKFVISSGITDTEAEQQTGMIYAFYEGNDKISKFIYFDGYTDRLFSDNMVTENINEQGVYLSKSPSSHGVFPYDNEHRFIRIPVGDELKWAIISGDTIVSGVDLTGKAVSYYSDSFIEEELTSTLSSVNINGELIDCYVSELSEEFQHGLLIDDLIYVTDESTVFFSFNSENLEMKFSFPISCSIEYSTSKSDYLESDISLITKGIPDSIVVPDNNLYEYKVHIAKAEYNDRIELTPVVYSGDIENGEIAICEASIVITKDGLSSTIERVVSGKPIIIPNNAGVYTISVHVTSGLEYDVMPSGNLTFTISEETPETFEELYIPLAFEVE